MRRFGWRNAEPRACARVKVKGTMEQIVGPETRVELLLLLLLLL
jgi:hypothetical protein